MPYTPGNFDIVHQYVQWGGVLPGGEIWSCGLRIAPVAGVTPAPDQALCDGIATAISTFHSSTGGHITSRAQLQFVKVNPIGVDGKYAFPVSIVKNFSPVILGGGTGSATPPNQVALAATLTTDVARGVASKGRFYIPVPDCNSASDGLLATADVTAVKTAVNLLVTNINAVSANYDVAVFSRKSGAATHRLVTGCKVGRVLDTIRRRRNKIAEKYV
jgi:hypothetical protein